MTGPRRDPRDDRRVVDRLPADLARQVADELEQTSPGDAEIRLGDPQDRNRALLDAQHATHPPTSPWRS